jgi:hypothetical protein
MTAAWKRIVLAYLIALVCIAYAGAAAYAMHAESRSEMDWACCATTSDCQGSGVICCTYTPDGWQYCSWWHESYCFTPANCDRARDGLPIITE